MARVTISLVSSRHAAINDQLSAFSSRYESELDARDRMMSLLDSSQALSRYHYEPGHITASGFVLDPTGTAVALVDHPKIGKWLQPGGHVEPEDADLESAARREVEEEIGLTNLLSLGMFDLDIHTFPDQADQPTHLHFDVRYAFRSESAAIHAGEHEAAWIPLTEIGHWNDETSVVRPVAKLRALIGEAS